MFTALLPEGSLDCLQLYQLFGRLQVVFGSFPLQFHTCWFASGNKILNIFTNRLLFRGYNTVWLRYRGCD